VQLTEFYPKRKRERAVTCWIVTTDMELPLEEVREAAHQRWLCRVPDYAEASQLVAVVQQVADETFGIV